MSEENRGFVAGEKITPATTLGHEASGMSTPRYGRCSAKVLLGFGKCSNGYSAA